MPNKRSSAKSELNPTFAFLLEHSSGRSRRKIWLTIAVIAVVAVVLIVVCVCLNQTIPALLSLESNSSTTNGNDPDMETVRSILELNGDGPERVTLVLGGLNLESNQPLTNIQPLGMDSNACPRVRK